MNQTSSNSGNSAPIYSSVYMLRYIILLKLWRSWFNLNLFSYLISFFMNKILINFHIHTLHSYWIQIVMGRFLIPMNPGKRIRIDNYLCQEMRVPSSVLGLNAAVAIHFTHVTKGDSGRIRESVGIVKSSISTTKLSGNGEIVIYFCIYLAEQQ